jgi:alpha-amylase
MSKTNTEPSIYFPIVFHFHQPVDNFPWVFEESFQKAYKPLIQNIYDFPEIKVTLHFSGNILEWFIENKPKFINKIREMAHRGQIEIIGGGYYEPIYAVIPRRDRIAQIRKLTQLIKKEFHLAVNGAWLSERVWEPNYPSFLVEAGLKYVIVDDNHFRSTGISQEDTLYSYNTEDEGNTLRIFPINEDLRYLTPWKPTTQTIDHLKTIADEKGDRMALLISDAEKMGVWGSTHQICYDEGCGHNEGDSGKPFIPTLFKRIRDNDWIKSITLSDYMEKYPAKELVYLPTASYDKMEEWVLPTKIRRNFEDYRDKLRESEEKQDLYMFLKGGFWRYFLVKYPESNNMHKKMLYIREKLLRLENKLDTPDDRTIKTTIKEKMKDAWEEIYKAQCNDAYWHGLFGGVYLQFLRFAIYKRLINAENLIDEINQILYPKLGSYMSILPVDFYKKSRSELILESDMLNLYIDPAQGGTIFELDYKPKSYNLLNTLTRWEEAYHEKEKIENKEISVDRFRRSMLRFRIFQNKTSLDDLAADTYDEYSNIPDLDFKVKKSEKDGEKATIILDKLGEIKDLTSEKTYHLHLQKKIEVEKNVITFFITGNLKNSNQTEKNSKQFLENLNFGIDIPFFFNGDPKKFSWKSSDLNEHLIKDNRLQDEFEYIGSHFSAYDETYDLTFEVDINSDLRYKIAKFPLISYTWTDEGYKNIYQGINLIPTFNFESDFTIKIRLTIT